MIFLFGTKRCRFCKEQKEHLRNTFGSKGWVYFDIVHDQRSDELIKIAEGIGLDNIPAVVVAQEKKIIFKQDGKVSPDKLFYCCNDSRSSMPFTEYDVRQIAQSGKSSTILAVPPVFGEGDVVAAKTYGGEHVGHVKIKEIQHVKSGQIDAKDWLLYQKRGGLKQQGWFVEFEKWLS